MTGAPTKAPVAVMTIVLPPPLGPVYVLNVAAVAAKAGTAVLITAVAVTAITVPTGIARRPIPLKMCIRDLLRVLPRVCAFADASSHGDTDHPRPARSSKYQQKRGNLRKSTAFSPT